MAGRVEVSRNTVAYGVHSNSGSQSAADTGSCSKFYTYKTEKQAHGLGQGRDSVLKTSGIYRFGVCFLVFICQGNNEAVME